MSQTASRILRSPIRRRASYATLGSADPLVVALRKAHASVIPSDVGSDIDAPLAWPLRARGHLVGILVAGEHDYLESFDASEIEAVQALADGAAANLTFLDPSLTAHLVHTPNNLPPLASAFIGRERELAECREILSTTRLLTLTGFGGAGKSRLANELARGALDFASRRRLLDRSRGCARRSACRLVHRGHARRHGPGSRGRRAHAAYRQRGRAPRARHLRARA